jgi:hypothetical protein
MKTNEDSNMSSKFLSGLLKSPLCRSAAPPGLSRIKI